LPLTSQFLELCRKIGCDPLLVQGPGGNASCKSGGILHVKASGTELACAMERNIFAAVDISRAIAEIDGAGDGSCRSAMTDPESPARPSIETTFHALLPQKYVFHYHSVAAICHSISSRGKDLIPRKLNGIGWDAIPYRKPGIALSKAIRSKILDREVEALILENHGIIVAHDSLGRVAELIDDIERRLHLPRLPLAPPRAIPPAIDGWIAPAEVSGLAFDSLARRRASAGSYYPDHVVFLGPAVRESTLDELASPAADERARPVALVKDSGFYIRENATAAQQAMLKCLFEVLARVPPEWKLNPIGGAAEAELLDWDAEKYRQSLAADR